MQTLTPIPLLLPMAPDARVGHTVQQMASSWWMGCLWSYQVAQVYQHAFAMAQVRAQAERARRMLEPSMN